MNCVVQQLPTNSCYSVNPVGMIYAPGAGSLLGHSSSLSDCGEAESTHSRHERRRHCNMFVKYLIAPLAIAVSVLGAPVELEARQSCSPLQLVHVAGTTEIGLGIVGTPLALALASSGATTKSITYDTTAEYIVTVAAGAAITEAYLRLQSIACPNQRFVLSGYSKAVGLLLSPSRMTLPLNTLSTVAAGAAITEAYLRLQSIACPNQRFVLSGYSKGALVLHKLDLSSTIKSKIASILVFGDPARNINSPWPINNPSVDLSPKDGSSSSQNIASFCNTGDLFCAIPGYSLPAHFGRTPPTEASVLPQHLPRLGREVATLGFGLKLKSTI
ncbi:cutinase [Rhizoctonia solani]|uniref:Cutinase n=1 Tax=Rhizoctonia solani TaxID=456999 RepID=A0A8H8P5B9_9AGAM|nr:cutinase [Rhizoctonia solani]QRW25525.1 cutinase [Rhizoctonia solani]